MVGGPSVVRKIGGEMFETRGFGREQRMMQHVANPRQLLWATVRWAQPSLFPGIALEMVNLPNQRCEIRQTVPADWRPCPQLFEINHGFFAAMPLILGLEKAIVESERSERSAVFTVTLPPSLTLWARLRRTLVLFFSANALIEEMREQNQMLQHRFADLAAARDAAEDAKAEAERALAVRTTFMDTLSHELRTPLNGILGFSELLGETEMSPDQTLLLDKLQRSGQTLQGMVDGMLDYADLSRRSAPVVCAPFSLGPIVTDLGRIFEDKARKKGLVFSVTSEDGLHAASLQGDAARVRQVLTHLLDNALKFTESGEIGLRLSATEDRVRVDVVDTGPGIPEPQRETIFTAYTQADGSMGRRFGGLGLGLARARQLVVQMNGEMGLETDRPVGSDFWFSLPRAAAAPERLRGRVLVAEDNALNQLMLRRHLESLGLSVEMVGDGAEALAACARQLPDLVLMDCQMPGVDGLEATAALRERGFTRPIVAVTANASAGDRERCLDAGMDDYLPKPVSRDQLASAVNRWLCGPRALASRRAG